MDLNRFGFGVNVSGLMQSEKGLGAAVRSDVYSLKAAGIPYVLNNITDAGSANADKSFNIFSNENPYLFNLIHVNPDALSSILQQIGASYLEGHYNIGFWVWELDQFPDKYRGLASYLDEIWTPSDYSFQAISKAVDIPVVRMPHSIKLAEGGFIPSLKRSSLKISEETFMFLFIFDFQSEIERKNPYAVINAFKAAFAPSDAAALFIKTSHSAFNPAGFHGLLDMIKGSNITILDSVSAQEEVYSLISLCDCYVSLHRSEGFGLTLAEAMALGKPVIATGYSGNMDFMNMENSYPVPYKLIEIDRDYGNSYSKGNRWAEPDVEEAAGFMRRVFEDRDESASIGLNGEYFIKKFHNPSIIGNLYKKRLGNIAGLRNNKNMLQQTGSVYKKKEFYSSPGVSVCICTYNTGKYVKKSIESALSQDYGNLEVIIVDDCSTDGTAEIVKEFLYDKRIKFFQNEINLGLTGNIKQALKHASGEWVAFLSSDDYWNDPYFISKSMHRIRRSENITAVCGGVKVVYEEEPPRIVDYSNKIDSAFNGKDLFLKGLNMLGPANVNFNALVANTSNAKEYYKEINDIIVTGGDDYYFWRLCLDGNIYFLGEPFLSYRYHQNNASVVRSIDDFTTRLIYTAVVPVMAYTAAIKKDIIPQIILYKWLFKNIILYLERTFSIDDFKKIKTAYEDALVRLGFSREQFGFDALFSKLGEITELENKVYNAQDTLKFEDIDKNGFNTKCFIKEAVNMESGDYEYLFNNDSIFKKGLVEKVKYYLESVGILSYNSGIKKCFNDIGISEGKIRDFFDVFIYSKAMPKFDFDFVIQAAQDGETGCFETINGNAALNTNKVSNDSDIMLGGRIIKANVDRIPDAIYIGLAQDDVIKYSIKANFSGVFRNKREGNNIEHYAFYCVFPADLILRGEYDLILLSVKAGQAVAFDDRKKLIIR